MQIELLAITPNAEKIIEQAGRTCYRSCAKAKSGSEKDFVHRIIANGHHSVLEHAYATFCITGVSRSLTHQLVRHRLCAFSQQSQRYVNEANFNYVIPKSIAHNPETQRLFTNFMSEAKDLYRKLQELGIKNEDARSVLPNAVQSTIVLSANFRELRHIFCVRCNKKTQDEIRRCCLTMLKIMKKESPIVFEDFIIDKETATAHTRFPYLKLERYGN